MSLVLGRLAQLGEEHGLPEGSRRRLRALLEALEHDPLAPTTVTDPARAVEVHVADALDGLRIPALREAGTIADLGSGAGFPGLVLAVALPTAHVTLLDAVAKKVAFIGRAAAAAGLENVTVLHARAEEWSPDLPQDVVTARALAPLTTLIEYSAPLLRLGGHLVAWKGEVPEAELADGSAAATLVGLSDPEVVAVPPRPGAAHHALVLCRKLGPTPGRYPRRPGMARKRPITAVPPR